jgi:RNA polymerase primary sigma factor
MDTRPISTIVDEYPPLPAAHQLELITIARRGIDARQELADNGHDPIRAAELHDVISAGDEARDALVLHNTAMIFKVAWQYVSYMPLEDLFQDGVIGLITAIERFDPDRGFHLSTYAMWWIRQSIVRSVANKSRTIRLTVHQHHRLNRLNRMRRALAIDLGRDPTPGEIAAAAEQAGDAPIIGVEELTRIARDPISLDAPFNEGDDPFSLFIVGEEDAAGNVESSTMREQILEIVDTLSPREALAIKMRFGLDGHEAHKLQDIGDVFGVTRERARQIVTDGLRHLRHPSRRRRLQGFLEE